jgi:glutaredoxin
MEHRGTKRRRRTTARTSRRTQTASTSLLSSFRLAIIVVVVAVVAISNTSSNTMLPSLLLSHTVVRAFRPLQLSLNRRFGGGAISSASTTSTSTSTSTTISSSTTITSRLFASVTGTIYTATNANDDGGEETNNSNSNANNNAVVVTLYTKEGCTLCDKVKDVLKNQISQDEYPHSLKQIDITDTNQIESYDRYKYDIPVLHIGYETNSLGNDSDSVYWTKHRLDVEEAKVALKEAIIEGSFQPRQGRPNAAAMER